MFHAKRVFFPPYGNLPPLVAPNLVFETSRAYFDSETSVLKTS